MSKVRKERLAALIGDVKRRGAVADFARAHDLDATYLRQLLSGHRNFGEKAARKMEKEIGLEPMYMDGDQSTLPDQQPNTNSYTVGHDTVSIPRFDMEASMGPGRTAQEGHVDVVERIEVNKEYLRRQVRFSSVDNLAIITALGDSMSPTFNDCDLLLVDRGVKDVKVDAVYVIHYEGEYFVKRLQRRPGESMLMISDNSAYQPQPINHKADNFTVMGRVLMAWNAKRL